MKKIITILFMFYCLNPFNAQVIYLNTNSDDIYKLDINSCQYEFVVHVFYNITDISFHPDGSFYGLTNVGQLIRIDTITGTANVIHDFDGQAFNSLTISGNGTIYATGDQGELWSYNKITDQATYHGDFGFRATGDLTFYKGNLYVAVEADRIVLIDINNPANSSVAIDENIPGEIFGIVSYAANCDSINCYAISSGESSIYLIDFNNQSLQLLCNLNIRAGGGASTYEFRASSPIVFNNIQTSEPTCNGNDGSITMNISGGNEPLVYSINNTLLQPSNTFDNLRGGIYTIMVTDANGCTIAKEVILPEKDGPAIESLAMVEPTCNEMNGQINVLMNNGNATLQYSIDGINFQSSPLFDQVSPGWYIITVRDTAGCMDFDSIKVFGIHSVRIDSVIVQSPGCNDFEGALTIATADSIGVAYSIDGVNFQDDNTFDQLTPGNYLITVLDENGCTDTVSVLIEDALPLFIDEIQNSPTSCGKPNGSIRILTSGGTGQLQYSINNIEYQASNEFINLASGIYSIDVVDDKGCTTTDTVLILDSAPIKLESITSVSADCGESNGSALITVIVGPGVTLISMDGIASHANGHFSNLSPGEHEIIIEDEKGCRVDTFIKIDQLRCHIYVPNSFSPNQDGVNDFFQLSTSSNYNATIKKYLIFDRWGNMVYSANDFHIASSEYWWDGTFKRIGMGPGVFAYYIEVEDQSGIKEIYKGNLTLIR